MSFGVMIDDGVMMDDKQSEKQKFAQKTADQKSSEQKSADKMSAVETAIKNVEASIAKAVERKPAEPKQDAKDAKIDELTDDLKRVAAEFDNYKKRCDKDNSVFKDFAKADLIKKMLPVLDSFEMGLKNTKNHDTFVKGMELVYSQILTLLSEEGVAPIIAAGKRFDPYFHEALMMEDSDGDDGVVLEEFQKGYLLKGKVIRHSEVKVSRKP
jgi:molecular chaperone GrpE